MRGIYLGLCYTIAYLNTNFIFSTLNIFFPIPPFIAIFWYFLISPTLIFLLENFLFYFYILFLFSFFFHCIWENRSFFIFFYFHDYTHITLSLYSTYFSLSLFFLFLSSHPHFHPIIEFSLSNYGVKGFQQYIDKEKQ